MEPILLIDGNHGVYIPKLFAEKYSEEAFFNYREISSDLKYLISGPDAENYWDAWDAVLRNAIMLDDGGRQFNLQQQDGDLWAIPKDYDAGKELSKIFNEAMSFKSDKELAEFKVEILQLQVMDVVQSLMKKKKMTKIDLAEEMGVTQEYLTDMFTADTSIFKENIVNAITALTKTEK